LTPETVTGLFFLVNFLQLEYFPRTG
jgi:hypothetical protein